MTDKFNILKRELEELKEREIKSIAREKQFKARAKELKSAQKTNNKTIGILNAAIK